MLCLMPFNETIDNNNNSLNLVQLWKQDISFRNYWIKYELNIDYWSDYLSILNKGVYSSWLYVYMSLIEQGEFHW